MIKRTIMSDIMIPRVVSDIRYLLECDNVRLSWAFPFWRH